MQRTKLDDRVLPNYSRGEEIFNSVSHIVGGVIGIAALVLCVIMAAYHRDAYAVVSAAIFGASLIILYTMSSIYHGLSPKLKAKKVFQILDHCSVFILIAGTYTPFTLCTLRRYDTTLGWTMFGIIWGIALIGIILNSIDLKKFQAFSMICYLGMGWAIVFKANILPQLLTSTGFALLIIGGLFYTVGAMLYGIGKKKKWMHSIFHINCVIGSILHILCILFYVV